MAVLTVELSRWASDHHAVITTAEALHHGVSREQLRRAAERGELVPVHRNVFRVAGAPRTWEQDVLIAVRAAGPGSLASHRAAAALWGLDGARRARPEIVTARHLRSWAPALGICHESKDLRLAEPVERLAIPCTGLCRTLIDLGAVLWNVEPLQAAIDDAVRRELCSWDDLLHTLARHSKKGRRGAGPLRAILEECYGTRVPDSRFNRLVQRLIVDSGLLAPVVEHEIRDASGRLLGRVDLALPELKIAIELDSRRHHLSADAFESDRPRQNNLELEGWLVLRYTWRLYIHQPNRIVAEVAAAIRSRMANP
jgi:Transcriptional regulator, AbiEi antitoxin/Protein of unknown function (DUF559)